MTLLAKLAAGDRPKLSDLARGNTRVGRLIQRAGVPPTPDLKRVLALPQRTWENDPETEEAIEVLTHYLRAPGGSWVLLPQQAVLLREAHDLEGAIGGLKVGEGKTPISFLLPTVMESKCSVLLLPGSLARKGGKTDLEFRELAKQFVPPEGLHLLTYDALSDNKNEDVLEELQPDLIIPDEGHELAGLHHSRVPGCVRRVERYLEAHPTTRFVPMSGTMVEDRPMSKYHHLMRWSIGEGMPLPLDWSDAVTWSRALDAEVPMSQRMNLGALECFGKTREEAFKGCFERIRSTPGVVITREANVAASLQIELIEGPNPCREQINAAWAGKDPDGNPLDEYDAPRMIAELEQGFWYEPDPRPPQRWLDYRRRYKQHETMMLEARMPGLDTPLQVEQHASRAGNIEVYNDWAAIRDTYKYNRITRWVSYDVIDFIVKHVKPGTIIWTYHRAPGELMAKRHGLRFFDKLASDSKGPIESAAGETCVASIVSCSTGRNLQQWWYHNFYTTMPPYDLLEQSLGRTHRQGQKADTVFAAFLAHTQLLKKKIANLRQQAREGSGTARLCLADWV